MQKCIFVFLLAAALMTIGGCQKTAPKVEPVRLNVVCTVLSVYVMAQNLVAGVPGISLQLLLSPQIGCPHDYALTPPEAASLEKADILIINGLGLEAFLRGNPALDKPGLRVINATQTVDSISSWEDRAIIYPVLLSESEHAQQHDDAMNSTNPHAWVSPFQAVKMTLYIGWELSQIDSQYAQTYLANAQEYSARLDSLGQALRKVVINARNPRIVTFHNAFDYFAQDLGLAIVGLIESDPGVEPSARALAELADRIKEAQAAAIFSEPQYSDRLVKMLAAETGLPGYELDPASSGAADAESYLRIMQQNLLTLEKALLLSQ